MGDEEEEPKYKLFVSGSEGPRPEGSQHYTGRGKAAYLNGDSYDGDYVEGFRRGKGTYTFKKHGDTYQGHYVENKKDGFGKMQYKQGTGEEEEEAEEGAPKRGGTYVGHFTEGKRGCKALDGEGVADGTFTYINGDEYVGQWLNGKKHGKGTYTYAKDGTQLAGEWENGKITNGKWIFPNGTFYSGKFRYNKPFGKGVWVFQNGNQLTGDYVQKEQAAEDEPPADEEEGGPPKPDPKVWCHFQYGATVAVRGGAMSKFGA
mmetsp:Transcript_35778/g.92020  ORF Transcript_35778/g.92020 Transcript_35778/m.92020 type:complete len:260 (-) Transcript_35778:95-874(-)